jgi:16S rRNA (guanine527-N7)-methyltransferase
MLQILKYFPALSEIQKSQFEALNDVYQYWNARINVISRKDIENLYEHHVLHSLSIAKVFNFRLGTTILDVGTGGGFPGIPLAILFPECRFTLIDGINKKIKVGTEVARDIGLRNTILMNERLQAEKTKFEYVVSRAVMPLSELAELSKKNISTRQFNSMPNGLICLKGGELEHEILPVKNIAETFEISDFFSEEYFQTKKVVYLPL